MGGLSRTSTYDEDERGITCHGDGGLIVVVGVTPHQGGRESRPQGEGGQVTGYLRTGRYA